MLGSHEVLGTLSYCRYKGPSVRIWETLHSDAHLQTWAVAGGSSDLQAPSSLQHRVLGHRELKSQQAGPVYPRFLHLGRELKSQQAGPVYPRFLHLEGAGDPPGRRPSLSEEG